MSLFQCENCGCCENTALSAQGFAPMKDLFDWTGIEDRKGMLLCSVCGPTRYRDGVITKYGEWHRVFPRVFLPKGMFITNRVGNLAHKETGDENFRKYEIKPTCTDERPCVNWEQYDRFMAHADDIIDDKTKNTLADWISDYGGRENEKGYVEFGSHYALAKMLDRRDKEVIRYVLVALVSETPQQAATPEADDLAQFLEQTDFDAAEKVASEKADDNQTNDSDKR